MIGMIGGLAHLKPLLKVSIKGKVSVVEVAIHSEIVNRCASSLIVGE